MREADERAEDVQRARVAKAALKEDARTEDDAVPQPSRASPSAARAHLIPNGGGSQQRGKKRALESDGRDGGGERAPVAKEAALQPSAKEAALQPSVAAAPAAPASPSPRSPTASAGANTLSGDVGRAPACPSSSLAVGADILGAVDALLAEEFTFLAEPMKERLRSVIRDAAAREQASRAEIARRVTERLEKAKAALEE